MPVPRGAGIKRTETDPHLPVTYLWIEKKYLFEYLFMEIFQTIIKLELSDNLWPSLYHSGVNRIRNKQIII